MIPRISVVMPTHNRGHRLWRTLSALNNQTVSPEEYELILVGDGCTDNTSEFVAGINVRYRMTFIAQPSSGAASARNRGAAVATAAIILFLDDDMEASPGLIRAHLDAHASRPGGLVLGYFPIPTEDTGNDPFAIAAREWWDEGFRDRMKPSYRFSFRDFCTGNISLPADLFRAAGGFYQKIPGAAGEDYELGYRLLRLGTRFQFVREALSIHHDANSMERALARAQSEGRAHALIAQRHGELFWSFKLHHLSRVQQAHQSVWRFLWQHPRLVDLAPKFIGPVVRLAHRLKLHNVMWRLYGLLVAHAYWRGARAGFPSLAAWDRLVQDAPIQPDTAREIDIDIASDLDMLYDRLEREHADSARLYCKGEPLGRIAPVPGAERLAAIHVREHVLAHYTGVMLGLIVDKYSRLQGESSAGRVTSVSDLSPAEVDR